MKQASVHLDDEAVNEPWTDEKVVALLGRHTYDDVHNITRWSRGRIYNAACRLGARKTEARIAMRKQERAALQQSFLQQVIGSTLTSDVLDFLAGMPDDAVDLTLTSLPYNVGKSYGGSAATDHVRFAYYYGWAVQVVSEIARTLKPGGTLCLQVGSTRDDAGRLYPIDVLLFEDLLRAGLTFQSRVVWHFRHGLTPSRRLAERYETMLVFSKGDQPQVFNANAGRIPQQQPDKRAFKGPRIGKLSGHWAGAAPTNVWDIRPVGANHGEKTDHPCQLPLALVKKAIMLYSNAGALVMDCFSGSGTTHVGCVETGRAFVGADLFYEDTRNQRLAKAFPDLVSLLPGVTDESVAVWQAEARRVDVAAQPIHAQKERDLFAEFCSD